MHQPITENEGEPWGYLWYYIYHTPHVKEFFTPQEAMDFLDNQRERRGFWPIIISDENNNELYWYNEQCTIETLKEESRKLSSYLNHC